MLLIYASVLLFSIISWVRSWNQRRYCEVWNTQVYYYALQQP